MEPEDIMRGLELWRAWDPHTDAGKTNWEAWRNEHPDAAEIVRTIASKYQLKEWV